MARGGKRKGAGRPKGTGKFGEPTKAVRLPVSKIDDIIKFVENGCLEWPVYSSKAQAAYPEPDNNIPAEKVNLSEKLITNPKAMFLSRMESPAMEKAGIMKGDLLITDKSVEPQNGDIILAVVNGEFLVRRLVVKNGKIELKAENPKFGTIKIKDQVALNIWGVIQGVMRIL